MVRVRAKISKKNKYYLSPHAFYSVYHYALQYNEWRDKAQELSGAKAIDYSSTPVQTSNQSDQTYELAVKLSALHDKMHQVERVAKESAPDLYDWLLLAVTNEGITYTYLQMVKGIPCGRNYYYEARRRFYFNLNKEINEGHRGQ